MGRPALSLIVLFAALASPAQADPRDVLRNCQALLARASQGAGEKPSDAEIVRCRQVVRDYKDRKVSQGIFAVRCAATGETWVGKSRNLDQQQNRIWFGLRAGGYINPAVQAAWKANGEGAFTFEVLETIEDADLSDYSRANLLKERDAHWRAQLGAPKLVG